MFQKKMSKKHFNSKLVIRLIYLVITAGLVAFGIWSQTNLVVIDRYKYEMSNLPIQYNGYKIAHITNLDNNSNNILSKINKENPDIVIVSGGLVNEEGNIENSVGIINNIAASYNTYYILQENDLAYKDLIQSNLGTNVNYIDNNTVTLNTEQMTLDKYLDVKCNKITKKELAKNTEDNNMYKEYINSKINEESTKKVTLSGFNSTDEYSMLEYIYNNLDNSDINLGIVGNYTVIDKLSSGTLDIIFTGGTYGLDIKYDGSKSLENMHAFISSGLCKQTPESVKDKRVFNFPEIQVIELYDSADINKSIVDFIIKETNTRFENDKGFVEYKYTYDN